MKSSFKTALLTAPLFTFLFLLIVHLGSCKSGSKAPPVAIIRVNDTSGSVIILHAYDLLPSGSSVQLKCKNCTDTAGGTTGSGKILFSGTLNMDIPANTDFTLQVISK